MSNDDAGVHRLQGTPDCGAGELGICCRRTFRSVESLTAPTEGEGELKRHVLVIGLLAATLLGSCGDDTAPTAIRSVDDIVNHEGTIRQIGVWGFAIYDESAPVTGSRYAPSNLPESFKQDGLRVLFSGRIGLIPPDERIWGIPFELSSIGPNIR